jgi:hypothetical protein
MAKQWRKKVTTSTQLERKRLLIAPWIARLESLKRKKCLPLVLRGRRFTYRGLRTIVRCVADHYDKGRTRISEIVCIRLGWRQPNGWLKDRACRDVLRKLEKLRLLKLPPPLANTRNAKPTPNSAKRNDLLRDVIAPVSAMPQKIELEFAKGNAAEYLWNALIDKHHYLGHRVQVGRCLKYLIRGDGKMIGAISFSSPAWEVAARNKILKQIGLHSSTFRDIVVNNSRFCILPNVRVPHLAGFF